LEEKGKKLAEKLLLENQEKIFFSEKIQNSNTKC